MICAPAGFRRTAGAAISRLKAFSLLGRRCRAYARRMRVGPEWQKPFSGPASVRPLRKNRNAFTSAVGAVSSPARSGGGSFCRAWPSGYACSAYPQNGVGAAHWAARRTPPHSLGPTATKALSKRGVPGPRPLPGQRERKTREKQSTEPPAPLRWQTGSPNWGLVNGVRGERSS